MEKPPELLGIRELKRMLRGLAEAIGKRRGLMGRDHVSASLAVLDILSDLIEDGYEAMELLAENGKRRAVKRKNRAKNPFID